MKSKTLEEYRYLYDDAVAKRKHIDAKIDRRVALYDGTDEVRDKRTGGISKKKATCYKNICFEMVETQINNSIPMPKVTPRDADDIDLALEIEGYLKNEMDRIQFEAINDNAERETYVQGSVFYQVGWDSLENSPITQGELTVRMLPLECVYPQPGVTELKDAEYIFTKEIASKEKLENLYKKTLPEDPRFLGKVELITCWYLNDKGYISRYGWVEDITVFDEDSWELRRFRTCKECGERVPIGETCPKCGSNKFEYKTAEQETLPEDLISLNLETQEQVILARKGDPIEYYKIRQLPFVMRRNVSRPRSLYGVSDIDVLENDQESLNKLLSKMEQNVLKGGSIVTVPDKTKINFDDETLKVVPIKDPKLAQYFSVQQIACNIQQEALLSERMYDNGRATLGITDSYQGKRDPTAESGKAKEISAAQAAGRLESKKRMKEAAYADLYQLMFKFLLAYCDERRTFARTTPEGEFVQGKFSRYNYIKGQPGNLYYNDRFLFSVDSASVLSTSRESLWQETTSNFQAGTLGNPADPATLLLFWNIMKDLGYPLAKTAIQSLKDRSQQLPAEMQQAIMQNPEILQTVQAVMNGDVEIQPEEKKKNDKA